MPKIERNNDTIVAIATPPGEGAIGIVRLSGPGAVSIAEEIFVAKNKKALHTLKTYTFRYGWIVRNKEKIQPGDLLSGDFKLYIIDEVIVSLMRAPRSYTREDVVEINSHGGPRALTSILEETLRQGARLAEPGEFTKRAFLNGRIDLAQAEAVLDIIQAKSVLALENSLSQLSGEISRRISSLRQRLLEILADLEATLDFSDSGIGFKNAQDFSLRISELAKNIEQLLKSSFQGRMIREGLKVVIFGRPNVGKSSLLNAILKQERAIVTSIAGTTRDTIEEYVNIKGLAVRLIDTAGILKHRDEIEKEAIAKTKKALKECDLVLFVLDGSVPLTQEDQLLAEQVKDKKALVVINKCDRPQRIDFEDAPALFLKNPLKVSALAGEHIEQLEDAIFANVLDAKSLSAESVLVSNMRHIEILKHSLSSLKKCQETLAQGLSFEFAALDLKKAYETLGELTGAVMSDEVLDMIFSKFCIGK